MIRAGILGLMAVLVALRQVGGPSYVSLTEAKASGQDHAGMYKDASDGQILRFSGLTNGLFVTMPWPGPLRFANSPAAGARIELSSYEGPYAQFPSRTGSQFTGLALFIVKDRAFCPQYAWWAPASMLITHHTARIVMNARIVDRNSCTLTSTPDRVEINYNRFTRVEFVPVVRGAYIYRMAVPTAGAYKGVARLHWSYPELQPSAVRLLVQLGNGSTTRLVTYNGGEASYEFTADRPGPYTFYLEVMDQQGNVIHRDRAFAQFP